MLLLFQGEAAAQQYTLTAAEGSFVDTGTAASLLAGRKVTGVAGSHSASGTAATLKAARILVAPGSSYAFTGEDVSLAKGQTLTASAGSALITGAHAYMGSARLLTTDAGDVSVGASDADLFAGRVIAVDAAQFALSNNQVYMGVHGGDVALSGGYFGYGERRRTKADIELDRELFGIPAPVADAISAVAVRQVSRGERDELKRLEELERELALQGIEWQGRYLAAFTTKLEASRRSDEETMLALIAMVA